MFKSSGRMLVFSVLSSQSCGQHVQSMVPSPQAQGKNKKKRNLAFAMTILHAQTQKAELSQAVNSKRHRGSTVRKQRPTTTRELSSTGRDKTAFE